MKRTVTLLLFLLNLNELLAQSDSWTWESGNPYPNDLEHGIYGTQGVGELGNRPGRRWSACTWRDASGNLWLFGGFGYSASGYGYLNDLWKYEPSTSKWYWIKGDSTEDLTSVHGSLTVFSASYKPGARNKGRTWVDASGNVWLFGGYGYGSGSGGGYLNDLWKYNPTTNQWALMKGDATIDNVASYGTLNTASASNKPGGRWEPQTWIDASNNLYVMGGYGRATSSTLGYLNDVWRYNPATNQWTWINGSNTLNNTASYGSVTVTSATNKPGARSGAAIWKDASGVFWMFGGYGLATSATLGYLNDVWKYNPGTNQWTWMHGNNTFNTLAVFGTMGTPAAANKPGSRSRAVCMTDASGNFWLFGGDGYNNFAHGDLGDLWRYNSSTNQWTWIGGTTTLEDAGDYGTMGVPATYNKPGSRQMSSGWGDASGNLYLFGGYGNELDFSSMPLYDLWRYNISAKTWTWLKGELKPDYAGKYGTKGITALTNKPGSRYGGATWADANGDIWLFGGLGRGRYETGYLSDLWKYNSATGQWTWMHGDDTVNAKGVYGTNGVAAPSNKPGARYEFAHWKEASGRLWIFGGMGYDQDGNIAQLNDLWVYDPSTNQWTWKKGSSFSGNYGTYGSVTVAAAGNSPGARFGTNSFADNNGHLWLFGGEGQGATSYGMLNDVWKYSIVNNNWTWMKGSNEPNSPGVYDTASAATGNMPGGRSKAAAALDNNNKLWLYGGYGYANDVSENEQDDFWTYDLTLNQWKWISRKTPLHKPQVNGMMGVSSDSVHPGDIVSYAAWSDASGNFWMFGGTGEWGSMNNNLWKYRMDLKQWVLIKGGLDNYGTQGIASPSNNPTARRTASVCKDPSGNLYFFGGETSWFYQNDLWKFNPCLQNLQVSPPSGDFCFQSSIELTGTAGTNYQWYKNGAPLAGATSQSLTTTDPGYYALRANVNGCTNIFSQEVELLSESIQPYLVGDGYYCEGDPVNVGIGITIEGQSYTWLLEGNSVYGPITGNGGNQSLQFNMSESREGTYYVNSLRAGCNSTTSNQVNVYYAKVRGMRVTTLNSTSATVRWYRIGPDDHFRYSINTSPFPSTDFATSDSVVTFNNLQPSTTYYVFAQAACGSSFQNWSDYTTISFTTCATNINTAITPAIGFTCTGSQLLSTSGGSSYQWLYNSIPIPGATSNTFQASNSGNYSVIINTDACSYSASNNATILWHSLPAGTCEWTGFQDTDWSNPVNWKCGTLPTSTSNVIIPNATRYPVLNQNWTIRSLNVKPNATLVVAPGVILTVTN